MDYSGHKNEELLIENCHHNISFKRSSANVHFMRNCKWFTYDLDVGKYLDHIINYKLDIRHAFFT